MHTQMAPLVVVECSDHNAFIPDHNLLNRMHTQMAPPLLGECIGHKSVSTKLKMLSRMHTQMAPPLLSECIDHKPFVPDHNLLIKMNVSLHSEYYSLTYSSCSGQKVIYVVFLHNSQIVKTTSSNYHFNFFGQSALVE